MPQRVTRNDAWERVGRVWRRRRAAAGLRHSRGPAAEFAGDCTITERGYGQSLVVVAVIMTTPVVAAMIVTVTTPVVAAIVA